MGFIHNPLDSLREPKEGGAARFWLVGGFVLICFLIAEPVIPRGHDHHNDANITSWLSVEKAAQLMRYHGTNGIMITEDRVFIKRDGRWICVYRAPSTDGEEEIRVDDSVAAMQAAGGNS